MNSISDPLEIVMYSPHSLRMLLSLPWSIHIVTVRGAYSFYVSAFLSYSRHSRPLLRAKDDAANQEYVHHQPWSLAEWRAMLRDKIALIVKMV